MKSYLLYTAMFLLILCLPFSGKENEVRWLWIDLTWVPLIFVSTSLICIGLYLYRKERFNKRIH